MNPEERGTIVGVGGSEPLSAEPRKVESHVLDRAQKIQALDPNDRWFTADLAQLYPGIKLLVTADYRRNGDPVGDVLKRPGSHPVLEEAVAAVKVAHWVLFGEYKSAPLESCSITEEQFLELRKLGRESLKEDGMADALILGIILEKILEDHEAFSTIISALGKERVSDQKSAFWDAVRSKDRDASPTLHLLSDEAFSYIHRMRGVELNLPGFARGEILPAALKPIQGLMKERLNGSCDSKYAPNVSAYVFGKVCALIGETALPDANGRTRSSDLSFKDVRDAVVALNVMARNASGSPKTMAQDGYDYLLRRASEATGSPITPAKKYHTVSDESVRLVARLTLMVGPENLGPLGSQRVAGALTLIPSREVEFLKRELNRSGISSIPEVSIGEIKGARNLLSKFAGGDAEQLSKGFVLLASRLKESIEAFPMLKGKAASISVDLSALADQASADRSILNREHRLIKLGNLQVRFEAAALQRQEPDSVPLETPKPREIREIVDPRERAREELRKVLLLARDQGFAPIRGGYVVGDKIALWSERARVLKIVGIELKKGQELDDYFSVDLPSLRYEPEFRVDKLPTERGKPVPSIWFGSERKFRFH